MELEEDEDRDSTTGVCKTVLRENAVLDMLEDLAGSMRVRKGEVWG